MVGSEQDTDTVVSVAILGAGNFANNTYAPILETFGDSIRVAAVWSRSEKSVASLFDKVSKFSTDVTKRFGDDGLDAILDDDEIDAVLIVLPPVIGLDVTMRALRKGKHVLQEKPVGTGIDAVEKALKEYDAMGQWRPLWGLAENYRFEDVYLHARRIMNEEVGDPVSLNLNASCALNDSSVYWHTPWRHSTTELPEIEGLGIGYLFEGPVHFMAAVRHLLGRQVASKVSCSATLLSGKNKELKQWDTVSGFMRFDSPTEADGRGASAIAAGINITYAAALPSVVFTVTCERGNIVIERVPGKYLMTVSRKEGGRTTRTEHAFTGVSNEIEYFVRGVRAHKKISGSGPENLRRKRGFVDQDYPDVAAVQGFRDMACLLTLFKSASTHKVEVFEG